MGIGVTVQYQGQPVLGQPLVDKLAEPGVIALDWIEATGVVPLIQGDQMAVAPMADTTTGRLAPPIPGGLQMQKVVVVLQGQPANIDLPGVLTAFSHLHLFLNFTMPQEGYI